MLRNYTFQLHIRNNGKLMHILGNSVGDLRGTDIYAFSIGKNSKRTYKDILPLVKLISAAPNCNITFLDDYYMVCCALANWAFKTYGVVWCWAWTTLLEFSQEY